MIPFIYKNWYYRLLTGLLAGLAGWLMVEVLLNIQYRYFVLFSAPLNYLIAMAYGIALLETMVLANRLIDRWAKWDQSPGRRLLIQTLSGLMIAFLMVIVLRLAYNYLFSPSKLIIFSDEVTILMIVYVLIIIFNLADLGYFINERYRKSLAEMERFRKENAEYQFEMLKLQLNPHFLFNSLNTLSSLVHEDAERAADFIRKLSDVYRYVLDNRNRELVSLSEELTFIRSFSYLLAIRFQGMIDFRFEVDEKSTERQIAPMTLQLLVENAVKHNVVSRQKPLTILIRTDGNEIRVSNNFQPRAEQAGTGMGLKNIKSRYAFLTRQDVEIMNQEGIFEVRIPLI